MASLDVHLAPGTLNTTRASRRKPSDTRSTPAATQHVSTDTMPPLTIPIRRGGSSSQPEQRPTRAAADNDVVIVSSGSESESDDDVVITGFKPAPRKRPRASPQQQQQQQAQQQPQPQQQQPPAGQQVERGLHGGYFVMPTWDGQHGQQQQQALPASPPREKSPEPVFKCLICLEGIKPDDMGITPCGHMFCYNCIVEAVRATKKCPKCRKNVTLKGLKKVYPN